MTASDLLVHAQSVGAVLWVDGELLRWKCPGGLPDDIKRGMALWKPELMLLLAANTAGPHHLLARLADHYNHPLADLLDWYRDELETFARMPEETATLTVGNYVKRRYIYRDAPLPTAVSLPFVATKELVACVDCLHFVQDEINPLAGIGNCSTQGEGSVQPVDRGKWYGKIKPSLYPRVERECRDYRASPEMTVKVG